MSADVAGLALHGTGVERSLTHYAGLHLLGENLEVGAKDRVLVIAPHPDDESIASGGLLQAAHAAGAAIRLLLLTDGDNNPWPQRWIEKRWRIGAGERARWGARRRAEAQAALRVLGVDAHAVRFLGLPDLGLTQLLMRNDAALTSPLHALLDEFAPTMLVFPAPSDRHPDHNAAHVALRFALLHSAATPRLLTFAVHGAATAADEVALPLDRARRERKQAAIQAHATQMQFSRRRFLAFAAERERFFALRADAAPEPAHPLQARLHDGQLQVRLDLRRLERAPARGDALFVALEGSDASERLLVGADWHAEQVTLFDSVRQAPRAAVALRREPDALQLSIDLRSAGALRQGYVKFARREPGWRVFDRFGWQPVAS